jgi:hypothetical protein
MLLLVGTGLNDVRPEIPTGVILQPAYPNPFNPTTNIRFTLAEGGNVDLALWKYMMLKSQISVKVLLTYIR